MARKTVDFSKTGIAKLPDDKPARVAPQVEAARRHYLERLNGWANTYLRGGIGSEHVGPDQRGQR